ncbi:MAG: thrombospondin type 3 repeat-containing protein [bacterium]
MAADHTQRDARMVRRPGDGLRRAVGRMLPVVLCLFHAHSSAAVTNDISGLSSGGGWTSNGSFRGMTSIGPGVLAYSFSSPAYISHAGFLNHSILRSDLDHDADSIIDENDPDDDNDGVADSVELAGNLFDPATPTDPFLSDSDGDGMSDISESMAGSNPLDASNYLGLSALGWSNGMVVLSWQGREGRGYEVLTAFSMMDLLSNPTVLGSVTAAGGTGPWQVAQPSYTNTASGPNSFYGVRLTP